MNLHKLLPMSFFIGLSVIVYSQVQPTIDNYPMYHPLVNPAANGSFSEMSAILFGRKQWYSIDGSPATIGIQFVQPMNKNSLGASIVQQTIGVHSKQNMFLTYTHRIGLTSEHNLAFGISPGFVMLHSNYNEVKTTSASDDEFSGSKSIIAPDFNFGLYYFTNKYFAGVSIPSLVKNIIVVSDGELNGESKILPSYWHYYFFGGYNIILSDKSMLHISTLVRKVKNTPADMDLNFLYDFNENFGAGFSYSTKKELLVSGYVNLSGSLKLAYCFHSYYNVKKQMLSSHEISISYTYLRSKPATIQLPRF
jgi:type IX secretion system PorP/SprF family membrane protein